MSTTLQSTSAEFYSDEMGDLQAGSADSPTVPTMSESGNHDTVTMTASQQISSSVRKFNPMRFALGLLCTTSGMGLILGIAVRAIETRQFGEDLAMPLVAVCVICGVMLLGGGFGIMATSSSGFDEAEFDRLAAAGNISAVSNSKRDHIAHGETSDDDHPHHSAAR